MPVQELPEVRLAEPSVDALADLNAHDGGDHRRPPAPAGEVDLTEPALAEQPFDAVLEPGLRAGDDLAGLQQLPGLPEEDTDGPRASGRVRWGILRPGVIRHGSRVDGH